MVVSRVGFGSVRFLRPVDVRKLDICSLVRIGADDAEVYYDMEDRHKPAMGMGLNIPAVVTLEQFAKDMDEDELREQFAELGITLFEYHPSKGLLVFRVERF